VSPYHLGFGFYLQLTEFTISARLDGTKRLMQNRRTASMADYLQLEDWEPPRTSANGKKRVSRI